MKDISLLKETDIYNLLLYAIFKMSGDPGYSTISELIYVLDKDSLLKFCKIFGGVTLKVPTLDELKMFTTSLLVFQKMQESGVSFNEACNVLNIDTTLRKDVAKRLYVIEGLVDDYGK